MTCATSHLALYAAVGSELTHYVVNVAAGTLTRRGAVTLPANVQYGWPHASGQRLYVGCSDSPTGRGSFVGGNHSLIRHPAPCRSSTIRSPCRPARYT